MRGPVPLKVAVSWHACRLRVRVITAEHRRLCVRHCYVAFRVERGGSASLAAIK